MTTPKATTTKKKSQRGGARPGAGRPLGSVNKITGHNILEEIAKYDVPFAQGLAQVYARHRAGEDGHLAQTDARMSLHQVVADKSQIDLSVDHSREIEAVLARLGSLTADAEGTPDE